MIDPPLLAQLRRDSARLLEQIQEIPGFEEAFERLADPPGAAAGWSFREVRVAAHHRRRSAPTGLSGLRWAWRPAADVTPAEAKAARERGDTRPGRNGIPLVLVETIVGKLTTEELLELDEYQDQVERFAKTVLFGCQWAAGATHEAKRTGAPIELPPARPTAHASDMVLRMNAVLARQPADRMSEGEMADAWAQWTAAIDGHDEKVHPAFGVLDEQRRRFLEAARNDGRRHVAEAAERWREWRKPARNRSRWQGAYAEALKSSRHRLAGHAGEDTSRKARHRVRPYLNAAVNGTWNDALPLEPSDLGPKFFGEYVRTVEGLADGLANDATRTARP